MNRLQKRNAILPFYTSIYDVCLGLRMSLNGSTDPLDKDIEDAYVLFLQTIIDTWEPSEANGLEQNFDNIIKSLVIATLLLYEKAQKIRAERSMK
jgi:hypothetical protein